VQQLTDSLNARAKHELSLSRTLLALSMLLFSCAIGVVLYNSVWPLFGPNSLATSAFVCGCSVLVAGLGFLALMDVRRRMLSYYRRRVDEVAERVQPALLLALDNMPEEFNVAYRRVAPFGDYLEKLLGLRTDSLQARAARLVDAFEHWAAGHGYPLEPSWLGRKWSVGFFALFYVLVSVLGANSAAVILVGLALAMLNYYSKRVAIRENLARIFAPETH
jgi:hypothetical protein